MVLYRLLQDSIYNIDTGYNVRHLLDKGILQPCVTATKVGAAVSIAGTSFSTKLFQLFIK
jgi:hypothetical protein